MKKHSKTVVLRLVKVETCVKKLDYEPHCLGSSLVIQWCETHPTELPESFLVVRSERQKLCKQFIVINP